MILLILFPMCSTTSFGAETPAKDPSRIDDPLPQSDWYRALKHVKSVPTNIWERMKLADQWIWPEYPDQVLFEEENRIKWPRYLSAALNTPEWLDLAFSNRIRREGFDYPFTAGQKGNTWDWGQRTRFRATTKWKMFRAELEFQGANSGEETKTDIVASSTFNAANVQQLFVSATLPNFGETGLRTDVHIGRINMDIGSRRLVARSRFSNASQAFDGIHWRLADTDRWVLRAFFTQAVFNDDKTNRVGLFTNWGDKFWGVSFENTPISWEWIQLYYFGRDEKEKSGRAERNHSTLGMRIYQRPVIGAYDYELESAWQFGTMDNKHHYASFYHLSLGYTFAFPWSPRILAMYDYASGTKNPNGNKSHTFDSLFGARRFEYSATSLFGPFYRSNISSPGIRLITHPLPTVDINVKYRAWYLAQSRDEWVNSG
ncbi:MAG: alginate export family protein, partial [Nitrospirales bacterium]